MTSSDMLAEARRDEINVYFAAWVGSRHIAKKLLKAHPLFKEIAKFILPPKVFQRAANPVLGFLFSEDPFL